MIQMTTGMDITNSTESLEDNKIKISRKVSANRNDMASSEESDTAWPASIAEDVSNNSTHSPIHNPVQEDSTHSSMNSGSDDFDRSMFSHRNSVSVFENKISRAGNPTPGAKFSTTDKANGIIRGRRGTMSVSDLKRFRIKHKDSISELETDCEMPSRYAEFNQNTIEEDCTDRDSPKGTPNTGTATPCANDGISDHKPDVPDIQTTTSSHNDDTVNKHIESPNARVTMTQSQNGTSYSPAATSKVSVAELNTKPCTAKPETSTSNTNAAVDDIQDITTNIPDGSSVTRRADSEIHCDPQSEDTPHDMDNQAETVHIKTDESLTEEGKSISHPGKSKAKDVANNTVYDSEAHTRPSRSSERNKSPSINEKSNKIDDTYSSCSASASNSTNSNTEINPNIEASSSSIRSTPKEHKMPSIKALENVLFRMNNVSTDTSSGSSLTVEQRLKRRKHKNKTAAIQTLINTAKSTLSELTFEGENGERTDTTKTPREHKTNMKLSQNMRSLILAEFIQQDVNARKSPARNSRDASMNNTPRSKSENEATRDLPQKDESSVKDEKLVKSSDNLDLGVTNDQNPTGRNVTDSRLDNAESEESGSSREDEKSLVVKENKENEVPQTMLPSIKVSSTHEIEAVATDKQSPKHPSPIVQLPRIKSAGAVSDGTPKRGSPLTISQSPLPAISIGRDGSQSSIDGLQSRDSTTSMTSESLDKTRIDSAKNNSDNTLNDDAFPSEVEDNEDGFTENENKSKHDAVNSGADNENEIAITDVALNCNSPQTDNAVEKEKRTKDVTLPRIKQNQDKKKEEHKSGKAKSSRRGSKTHYQQYKISYEKLEITVDNVSVHTEETVSPRAEDQRTNQTQRQKKQARTNHGKGVSFKEKPKPKSIASDKPALPTKKQKASVHDDLRRKLQTAMQSGSKEDLEKALQEVMKNHVTLDENQLMDACAQLELMKTSDSLRDAFEKRNSERLRYAINHCVRMGYVDLLQNEIRQAQQFLLSQQRLDGLKNDVVAMDTELLAEIRRYQKPRPLVYTVVKATLLLLGEHEGKTKSWKRCQRFLNTVGRNSFFSRIRDFNVDTLPPQIVSRAKQILADTSAQDAKDISSGVLIFYQWATGMIEEYANRNSLYKQKPPANKRSQRLIFRKMQQLKTKGQAEDKPANVTSEFTRKLPVLAQFALSNKNGSQDFKLKRQHTTHVVPTQTIKDTLSVENNPSLKREKTSPQHLDTSSAWVKTQEVYRLTNMGKAGSKPCTVCLSPRSDKAVRLPCVYHEKTAL